MYVIEAAEAPRFELPGIEFTGLASPSRGSGELCTWRLGVAAGLRSEAAHSLDHDEIFMVVSGAIQVSPGAPILRAGDAVELVGMLFRPRPPGNPGERDYAAVLLDRRIRAELRVSDSASAIARLDSGEWSDEGVLSRLRRRASAALIEHLPPREAAVAVALLLGDGSPAGVR